MSIYSFSFIVDDRRVNGSIGIELADDSTALMQAWHIGKAILNSPNYGDEWAEGVIIIESDDGRASFAISMKDVAAEPANAALH